MASDVVSILLMAYQACIGWLEALLDGVPGARQAIMWAIFVTLILSFLVVPIRGIGFNEATYSANMVKNRISKAKQKAKKGKGYNVKTVKK